MNRSQPSHPIPLRRPTPVAQRPRGFSQRACRRAMLRLCRLGEAAHRLFPYALRRQRVSRNHPPYHSYQIHQFLPFGPFSNPCVRVAPCALLIRRPCPAHSTKLLPHCPRSMPCALRPLRKKPANGQAYKHNTQRNGKTKSVMPSPTRPHMAHIVVPLGPPTTCVGDCAISLGLATFWWKHKKVFGKYIFSNSQSWLLKPEKYSFPSYIFAA